MKARVYLEQLGAEIVETSMLLGDAAYDVEPGWIGVPTVPFADYARLGRRAKAPPGPTGAAEPKSDEELLATVCRQGRLRNAIAPARPARQRPSPRSP